MVSSISEHRDPVDRPCPPRFRWLRRILLLLSAVIVAIGSLYAWKLHRADREISRLIAEARARGEPVEIAELAEPSVGRDAVPLLRSAAASVSWGQTAHADNILGDKFTSADVQSAAAWIEQNRKAIDLVRQARGASTADWNLNLRSPLILTLLPDLNEQRGLTDLLSCAAELARQSGDATTSLERIEDQLTVARVVDHQPFNVSHLTAIGIMQSALSGLERLGPLLARDRTVTPQRLRRLMDELLDEDELRRRYLRSMEMERVAFLDATRAIDSGRVTVDSLDGRGSSRPDLPERLLLWLYRPYIHQQDMRQLHCLRDLMVAAAASDYPTAAAAFPQLDVPRTGIEWVDQRAGGMRSGLATMPKMQFDALAHRRLAAVGLAVRLYQRDHGGSLPPSLDVLVPSYISRIPPDPFDPHGRPIRMTSQKPVRLYSVGGFHAEFSLEPKLPRPIPAASQPAQGGDASAPTAEGP